MNADKPKRLTQADLEELRRTVAHVALEDLANVKDGTKPEVVEDLRAYFHHFAKPSGDDHPCLRCGKPLMGGLSAFLLNDGGFEWGLVHGQGHCRCCGWPATAHHFIKDRNGEDLMTVRNMVLQVHPDDIEIRTDKQKAA
jgi:hypothetical protein